MTSSSSAPKLPLWIFFATDAVLIAAAGFIAHESVRPLSQGAMFAIVACILAGTIALCVPLIAFYERQKNEMLDDRQRALEALARTVAASAEQISIAAGGLHDIAELAQKNLKHADQLPHKLQEKIAEFQAQLTNVQDTEKEELQKQLEELRGTETERLQTLSDRLTRTVSEFAKLETATHQHLVAANEAIAKLSSGTASAIGKAQAAAELALAQARQQAAGAIGDATGDAVKTIEAAKTAATSDLGTALGTHITSLHQAAEKVANAVSAFSHAAASGVSLAPSAAPEPETENAGADLNGQTLPSKRSRKPRREEPVAQKPSTESADSLAPAAAIEPAEVSAAVTTVDENLVPAPNPTATAQEPTIAEKPQSAPDVPAERSAAMPVAPDATAPAEPASPAPAEPVATAAPEIAATETETATAEAAPEADKPARKRSTRVATPDDEPVLGLSLDLDSPATAADGESVLSSDGATRLIVTAYIGIGNRLFIRGSGPGLSWDKGVPLQFISIGKWRWETNDASTAVNFKLLKNDEQEPASPGALSIEPGRQHEVTATFN